VWEKSSFRTRAVVEREQWEKDIHDFLFWYYSSSLLFDNSSPEAWLAHQYQLKCLMTIIKWSLLKFFSPLIPFQVTFKHQSRYPESNYPCVTVHHHPDLIDNTSTSSLSPLVTEQWGFLYRRSTQWRIRTVYGPRVGNTEPAVRIIKYATQPNVM